MSDEQFQARQASNEFATLVEWKPIETALRNADFCNPLTKDYLIEEMGKLYRMYRGAHFLYTQELRRGLGG